MITPESLRSGAATLVGSQIAENETGREAALAPLNEKLEGAQLLEDNNKQALADEWRGQVNPQIASINAEYDKARDVMLELLGRVQDLPDEGVQLLIDSAPDDARQMVVNYLDGQMAQMDLEIARISDVKVTTQRIRQIASNGDPSQILAIVSAPEPPPEDPPEGGGEGESGG